MKLIYLIISLFFITPALHAKNPLVTPALVLQILNVCYDNQNNIGLAIAKCTLKKLRQRQNPDEFKFNFTLDSFDRKIPSHFKLIFYNKYGLVINCQGIASDKIRIQSCTQKQKKLLTTGQEISITPPK